MSRGCRTFIGLPFSVTSTPFGAPERNRLLLWSGIYHENSQCAELFHKIKCTDRKDNSNQATLAKCVCLFWNHILSYFLDH